jgi:hypothetical protein
MQGRFFKVNRNGGMGELPSTPLNENGALLVQPPFGRPPTGNQSAPTQQPGEMKYLGDNQSSWQAIQFTANTEPVKIQDYTYRKFFLIQNKSAAGTLYVGFGYSPNAGNGLVLPAGVGYEPFAYPINEIWVAASIAGVNGLLIFGV